MQALQIISDEHQSLAAVLHAIRFMLKKIEAGQLKPDLELFQAMVHYLDAFAEKRHHPKEDMLFARLGQRTNEGAEAIARLGEQHAAAPQRIAALERAVTDFVAAPSRTADFVAAFQAYAEFYRAHMILEETVVLPLVRLHLTHEEWIEVDRDFRIEMAINSGKDGKAEDFSALFSRLVESAPPPLGFGAHPYNT
ncbi:MAG: hemerythrin [Betaproteobacteria bacterium HGW-Betaproteobacteria-4]|jgi:hemerythrin-like domain-containing protein|nr:MAG: hemerythrin [Betaproteobacteria bacterium HGW-Betaproteobacteria-4]